MTIRVFDTESDGLYKNASRIWCIACRDLESRKEKFFGPNSIEEGLKYLAEADVVVAHNFLGHDYPLIEKLYPGWEPKAYEDSLILSRLYNPDRKGGHSIEEWGLKFNHRKPVHEDWSQYSEEMRHRCVEDTRINCKVLRHLMTENRGADWRDAVGTEYRIQLLQNKIEEHGFLLDKEYASRLADAYEAKQSRIEEKLRPLLPHKVEKGTTYQEPYTKAGNLKSNVRKWIGESADVSGPFSKVVFQPFSINSPAQVTEFLLASGWQPNFFNYKKKKGGGYELNEDGSYQVSSPRLPKVNEDQSCLDTIEGEAGKLFIEHRVLGHRIGILRRVRKKDGAKGGWLHEVRSDGRVEARAIPLGTNTGRYSHSQIVNIPSVDSPYGFEIRSCLTVPEGKVLVGTDASGLEARVAGHYTYKFDDGEFATELLEGDIHTKNSLAFSEAAGKEIARSPSKNVYYAILYGASVRKIASMLGVPFNVAEAVLDAFWKANPALALVTEKAVASAKNSGYVVGLDGRLIRTRSPHSALNALLQSAGAIIMKNAFLYALENKPWAAVCTMHDEAQVECNPDEVELLKTAWDTAGRKVTRKFDLNVPIVFESKVGNNYAETH